MNEMLPPTYFLLVLVANLMLHFLWPIRRPGAPVAVSTFPCCPSEVV